MRRALRVVSAFALASMAAAACGDDDGGTDTDAGVEPDATEEVAVASGPSKSGTIAISEDDSRVIMVNPEDDTVSVFDAATNTRTARLTTGDEPSAVVIHPNNKTAFVANRAAATVVKITSLDGTPQVGDAVAVGSEPVGLALSPTGKYLYVAELAEGRVAVIDTATMTETGAIDAPLHPRALAVTNDGDQDDNDEIIVVPEFFGEPNGLEGTDTSRTGRIRLYDSGTLEPKAPITLAPRDSGFAADGAPQGTATVDTSPNQLWAVQIIGDKLYVPSVSASPVGLENFQTNVQPVVYVGDLELHAEDTGALGTTNLAQLVRDQLAEPRFFLADTVDVGFVGDKTAYYVSRGADIIQRVTYDGAAPVLGHDAAKQIELNTIPTGSTVACQNPTGIAIRHAGGRAFVNCWVTRALGVVNLAEQKLETTVESTTIATTEADAQQGRRFYFTGRGRWSKNAWSDCGSCHPDGLSDNITWHFGTGPRQTTSMDGSFSHHQGEAQKQRVFNWTGIFDEIHDFERNTRGVSGGLGAITRAAAVNGACGNPATEERIDVAATTNLDLPVKEQQDAAGTCTKDWDKVEAFVKTIRPPRGLQKLDAASVARGAILFGDDEDQNAGGCVKCHGGAGWTASRRYFTPESGLNTSLAAATFTPPAIWFDVWNTHNKHIQAQRQPGPTAPEDVFVAPKQVSCVIRNVKTFGVPGDDTATAELEVRNNGTPAQGLLGYNIPSLYGLSLGAPYLHHGGAPTLEALFDDDAWLDHAEAGSAIWLRTGSAAEIAQRKADLINFLLTIDASTEEQDLPADQDGCILPAPPP